MPRFVILEHDHPHLHWDLMLEDGESLRTWRLSRAPIDDQVIDAEELPPHRLAYLDYEGPVSGGRGFVKRLDWGDYEEIIDFAGDELIPFLGQRGRGQFLLRRADAGKWVVHVFLDTLISDSP